MNQAVSKPASLAELDLEALRIGEDAREIRLESRADNQRVAAALVAQAVRTLEIFSRDLEAEIYDQPDFLEGIKRPRAAFPACTYPHPAAGPARVVRDGHRLVEMARRLSSFIEIRRPSHDYRDYNEAFLIADGTALLHRRLADRYEGEACFKHPLRARELAQFLRRGLATRRAPPGTAAPAPVRTHAMLPAPLAADPVPAPLPGAGG
jgi:hypothetical protein